jgi:hypothetical protein
MAPRNATEHLPPHTPGAGAKLLGEYLGRELPEVTDEQREELLAEGKAAMERARVFYGREPADI